MNYKRYVDPLYYAVCLNTPHGRCGVVYHANESQLPQNCIGYVGEDNLLVAVKRAGMMERNEPNAWGVIA